MSAFYLFLLFFFLFPGPLPHPPLKDNTQIFFHAILLPAMPRGLASVATHARSPVFSLFFWLSRSSWRSQPLALDLGVSWLFHLFFLLACATIAVDDTCSKKRGRSKRKKTKHFARKGHAHAKWTTLCRRYFCATWRKRTEKNPRAVFLTASARRQKTA
nr:hypothetical protein [Pandoravirus aubagnensis]